MTVEICYNANEAVLTLNGKEVVIEGTSSVRENKPDYTHTTYVVCVNNTSARLHFHQLYRDWDVNGRITYCDAYRREFVSLGTARVRVISLDEAGKISFDPSDMFSTENLSRESMLRLYSYII